MEELNTSEIGLQFLYRQLTIYDKFYYRQERQRITQSGNRQDTVRDNLFHNNTNHHFRKKNIFETDEIVDNKEPDPYL